MKRASFVFVYVNLIMITLLLCKSNKNLSKNPNVQILNPIQVLKNNEKENKRMYYQNECHLNPNGQRVIAEYILREINLD